MMVHPTSGLYDILLLQRYALATVYFSNAGHKWVESDGWLSQEDVCSWDSVNVCNSDGVITELDLSSNNLVGTIPVEITLHPYGGIFFAVYPSADAAVTPVAYDAE